MTDYAEGGPRDDAVKTVRLPREWRRAAWLVNRRGYVVAAVIPDGEEPIETCGTVTAILRRPSE